MEVWVRSVFVALMVINSAASVAGNLLVLLLLLLNKELQTESAALSLSLSLCDLGLGLTVLPLAAHSSLGDSTPSQAALCQARGFLFLLLQTASLNSLAWLTLHRFSQICLPLRYSRWWTGGRTLGALLLLWTFCLLNAALPLLGVGRYAYSPTMFLCSPSTDPASRGFSLYVLLLGVLLPLGSVCVLQGCMAATARRQARRGTFTCNHDHCFYVPASGYTRTAGLLLATSGQSIPPAYWVCVGVLAAIHISGSVPGCEWTGCPRGGELSVSLAAALLPPPQPLELLYEPDALQGSSEQRCCSGVSPIWKNVSESTTELRPLSRPGQSQYSNHHSTFTATNITTTTTNPALLDRCSTFVAFFMYLALSFSMSCQERMGVLSSSPTTMPGPWVAGPPMKVMIRAPVLGKVHCRGGRVTGSRPH
ncbi:Melatonin receptor type 1A [Merluccius polli]|uniref:Melatonin receptor type 1A n=1 Tax=Merluccius polli TaxID=89951 RepID=A0AA47PB28_MERPO|nr:Melatonin receptor type 1A [Merluccius polli]